MAGISLKKWFGGLSFASALFVFQACYGTPQDFGMDVYIEGSICSAQTGTPLEGIRIEVEGVLQYDFSDEEGKFGFYTERTDSIRILFSDPEPGLDGAYQEKDTLLIHPEESVCLNILLEEES